MMLILVLLISGFLCAGKPLFFDRAICSQVEERLRTEQITKSIPMVNFLKESGKTPKGDQRIMLIEFESGLRGVFKPGHYCYAEVAAYKASCVLRIGLVPPTVLRTISGVEGSVNYLSTLILIRATSICEEKPIGGCLEKRKAIWQYSIMCLVSGTISLIIRLLPLTRMVFTLCL